MRIAVKIVMEIDGGRWASEYGVQDENGKYRTRDVVADVRAQVLNQIQQLILNGDEDATAELA